MKFHSKSGKQWRVVLRGVESMEDEFQADILGHTLRIKQEVKHDGTLIGDMRFEATRIVLAENIDYADLKASINITLRNHLRTTPTRHMKEHETKMAKAPGMRMGR